MHIDQQVALNGAAANVRCLPTALGFESRLVSLATRDADRPVCRGSSATYWRTRR